MNDDKIRAGRVPTLRLEPFFRTFERLPCWTATQTSRIRFLAKRKICMALYFSYKFGFNLYVHGSVRDYNKSVYNSNLYWYLILFSEFVVLIFIFLQHYKTWLIANKIVSPSYYNFETTKRRFTYVQPRISVKLFLTKDFPTFIFRPDVVIF